MTLDRHDNTTVAKSFEHALKLLFEGSLDARIKRYRPRFVYRGLGDRQYRLLTSLQRLGGPFATLEGSLIRNFRKYAERVAYGGPESAWYWITLAQHHGLPTRLLDWTWSPIVALHFATSVLSEMGHDARIWILDCEKVYDLLPRPVVAILRQEHAFIPTIEMLDALAPALDSLDRMASRRRPFVLFFEPPSIDQRIVSQYALFSVMPGAESLIEDWLAARPNLWRAVDIPASIKWEVRDKLDSMNMNERVLFPGLDGLSSWLKRHYSPGPLEQASTVR
jgi:hypothetical protein